MTAATATRHEETASTSSGRWWMLGAVSVATFMLLLDITVVNVALPHIRLTLNSSFADVQWVLDAYALTLAAFLLSAGSLADVVGRRRVFVAGLVEFILASLACGLAPTALALNLARAAQGVGGAVMYAVAPAMIAQEFHGRQRGLAFGISGGVTGLAVAIGPLLGGVLTSVSWRWVFLINIPIGIVVAAVIVAKVRESRAPDGRGVDWPGTAVFSIALLMLVLGLIRGERAGWGSPQIVALLAGAGALLCAFVAIERRRKDPMFDLGMFRNRSFVGLSLATLLVNAAINVSILFQVLYVQDVLGFSAFETGLRFLPLTLAVFVVAAVAGALSGTVPARVMVGVGAGALAAGLLVMTGLDLGAGWTALLLGMIVSGAGIGIFNPTRAATAVALVPPERAGMASGTSETFQQGGVALGVAALGAVAHSRISERFAEVAGPHTPDPHATAEAVSNNVPAAIRAAPPDTRAEVANAAHQAFIAGVNEVLLIAGIVAAIGAVLGLALMRGRDMHPSSEAPGAPPKDDGSAA